MVSFCSVTTTITWKVREVQCKTPHPKSPSIPYLITPNYVVREGRVKFSHECRELSQKHKGLSIVHGSSWRQQVRSGRCGETSILMQRGTESFCVPSDCWCDQIGRPFKPVSWLMSVSVSLLPACFFPPLGFMWKGNYHLALIQPSRWCYFSIFTSFGGD